MKKVQLVLQVNKEMEATAVKEKKASKMAKERKTTITSQLPFMALGIRTRIVIMEKKSH